MKFGFKAALLATVVALLGCGTPSPEKIAEVSFASKELTQPVLLFSEVCLKTLPNFDTFSGAVKKQGLSPTSPIGGHPAYLAPGEKLLTATVFEDADISACAVGFLSEDNGEEIGSLFLQEASKRTGGQPHRLPRGQYNYVYHLKNGSVLVHKVRKKSGQIRHFIFVTKPVSRKEAASYVYG